MPDTPLGEDVAAKFTAAWEVFAPTCSGAVAPEATFQAWFAHYLISQFGIDRVAREVDFGHRDGAVEFQSPLRERVPGGSCSLDAVILRRPGVYLPFRTFFADRTAADRLADLAVISELKVGTSAFKAGLSQARVCQDFWKLSMLVQEADAHGIEAPLAFMCILDNNPAHPFDFANLARRLTEVPADPRVILLSHSIQRDRPTHRGGSGS